MVLKHPGAAQMPKTTDFQPNPEHPSAKHPCGNRREDPEDTPKQKKARPSAAQRAKGYVMSWQGSSGWITLKGDDDDGAPKEEKVYVNWREVYDGIALKVGDEVSFELLADDSGLKAGDVRLAREPAGAVARGGFGRGEFGIWLKNNRFRGLGGPGTL